VNQDFKQIVNNGLKLKLSKKKTNYGNISHSGSIDGNDLRDHLNGGPQLYDEDLSRATDRFVLILDLYSHIRKFQMGTASTDIL